MVRTADLQGTAPGDPEADLRGAVAGLSITAPLPGLLRISLLGGLLLAAG